MSLMKSYTVNYSYISEFEKNFDYKLTTKWMHENWITSLYLINIYIIVIFSGKQLMKNRDPFKLRLPLVVWNLFLAIFSITGTLRLLPEIVYILREQGLVESVCNNGYITRVSVSSFWSWIFTLSKLIELGDTVFIVLRKQQLIFLHWYHHITVLVFTWYIYGEIGSIGRWYQFNNYCVHSLMYSYYAFKAMNIKIPRFIAVFITSSQIIQMIFGFSITLYAFNKIFAK
ncbi:elongation of very long chain fatty acids protein 6-like [Oppia nitens]|uniref:elongation of very long chain fatty acids protein 6-like n=1 Tax=Oppia nitens TaxID=1686743 RepID=UPI0023DC3B28|nr:elongation of very long chain fatty acids protein 6-like [Oppia nitens]